MKINKNNFHLSTRAVFVMCDTPTTPADFVSLTKSGKVSSSYWFTKNGIIRLSNHWGAVASCIWVLNGFSTKFNDCEIGKPMCGFASFENFTETTLKFQDIVDEECRSLNELKDELKIEYCSYCELKKTKKGKIIQDNFNLKMKNLFNL